MNTKLKLLTSRLHEHKAENIVSTDLKEASADTLIVLTATSAL